MKIIQILPTLAYGDAIGNDTLALKKALIEAGYDTEIYAEVVAKPLDKAIAKSVDEMDVSAEDIAILHLSTGAKINSDFGKLPCKKIVRYHNVTPPEYYTNNNPYIEQINKWALKSVSFLSDKVDYCIAVSEFNKQDLIRMGYKCRIDVLPILIPFDDYKKEPDQTIIKKYGNVPVILFTGRIVPNKKIEDAINAFCLYKKNYNRDAVLVLVGSYREDDLYYKNLQTYIQEINAKDIIFTGHIKFNEILAYYRVADIFLCQSEHEGFCVPLVEAMFFQVPIVAFDSTAIPCTLNGSAVLMSTKDPLLVAGMLNKVYTNDTLREKILANERERLDDFSYEKISKQFLEFINDFIKNGKEYEKNSGN